MFVNVLELPPLCTSLCSFVNICQTGIVARCSSQAEILLKSHQNVYEDAKRTWGRCLWIKGWSLAQINHISKVNDVNEALQNVFKAEISKFNSLPSQDRRVVIAFEQWKGFYRLHTCSCCNEDYAIHETHYCQNKTSASKQRTFDNLKLIVQIFFIEKYGTNLQLPQLAFTENVPSSDRFTDEYIMHLRNVHALHRRVGIASPK